MGSNSQSIIPVMSRLVWQISKDFRNTPSTCGVYQYWAGDSLLYIGKAVNIKARLSSHTQNAKLDAKEAAIVAGDTIRYTLCDTEFKALILESELIRTLKPPHNRTWKDDKSYLYIVIDLSDPFPRPYFARAHDLPAGRQDSEKLKLFGPFPNAKIAEEVLSAIRRLIPFCMAKKIGKRPCFYSRIGLCSPCPSGHYKGPSLVKKQYHHQILQVIRILEGKVKPVIKDLTLQMKHASEIQDFETALSLRTKIEHFNHFITTHSFTDRHFSYNNSAEKLAVLENTLRSTIHDLPSLHRIECYDASNSAMFDSVVSMTVMTNGLLDKGQYRRFKIKNPLAISDFDRLGEAITRRLKNKAWSRPDLIVIDGGIPQLRRLQPILDQQQNPPLYLGLAKHPDRIIVPAPVVPNLLAASSEHLGLQLLQQLCDEAHRFANSYRQILEKKRTRI